MKPFNKTHLAAAVCAACLSASSTVIAADEAAISNCVPEGTIETPAGVSMPALLPKNIPLPEKLTLMSTSSTMPDAYSPYKSVTVEFASEGSRESTFAYYEKALPAAGYRIVMWEKDSNMGLRFRGNGIDEGMLSISEYDCRPLINLYISFPLDAQ
jgi:hypothetical protein